MSRTNIDIEDSLIQEAIRYSSLKTKKEIVHAALEAFVKKQKLKEFLKLRGKIKWEGNLKQMRKTRTF